jgi:hypothetical protein
MNETSSKEGNINQQKSRMATRRSLFEECKTQIVVSGFIQQDIPSEA